MEETTSEDRVITIEIESLEKNTVLKISNNGEPIEKENLNNIFNHGFTTKKDGHGFGLHSCANYMKEMQGEISVMSDGIKGATFMLQFIPASNIQ